MMHGTLEHEGACGCRPESGDVGPNLRDVASRHGDVSAHLVEAVLRLRSFLLQKSAKIAPAMPITGVAISPTAFAVSISLLTKVFDRFFTWLRYGGCLNERLQITGDNSRLIFAQPVRDFLYRIRQLCYR